MAVSDWQEWQIDRIISKLVLAVYSKMHDDTAQLLASIKSTIQGLRFSTENTYSLKPLVWDVSTQGDYDIGRLLKSTGNLAITENSSG